MKIFGMAAAYQAIEEGRINEAELYELLYDMITISDNDAFNQIVRKIGKYSVSNWIQANGYNETYQCAGFVSGNNYWEKCISPAASEKMLALLKAQTLKSKIPAGIPEGIVTANKTGEYMGTDHDCAIVFLDKNPYVICVFSEIEGYFHQYVQNISDISKVVLEYMRLL